MANLFDDPHDPTDDDEPALFGPTLTVDESLANLSDDELIRHLKQNYGYLAWALDNPEVRDLLLKVAREGLSEERAFGILHETDWWQKTQASARMWEAMKGQDPAEAQDKINDALRGIDSFLSKMGLNVSGRRKLQIAEDSLRFDWDEQELTKALLAEVDWQRADRERQGMFGGGTDSLLGIAEREYHVPMSRDVANEWHRRILEGTATEESFRQYLSRLAAGRFPEFADEIQKGITPGRLFDSYRETAAQVLEIDADQVDLLNDPRFSRSLSRIDENGKRRAVTMGEWQTHLRSLPEWGETHNAKQTTADISRTVANMFNVPL